MALGLPCGIGTRGAKVGGDLIARDIMPYLFFLLAIVAGAVAFCAGVGVRTLQQQLRHSIGEKNQRSGRDRKPEKCNFWPSIKACFITALQRRKKPDKQ